MDATHLIDTFRVDGKVAVVVGAGHEAVVVEEHRGHDAGRAVGGCGDHSPAGSVLLVHRQRRKVHPVHGGERVDVLGVQAPVQRRGAPLHAESTGQFALTAAAA